MCYSAPCRTQTEITDFILFAHSLQPPPPVLADERKPMEIVYLIVTCKHMQEFDDLKKQHSTSECFQKTMNKFLTVED